MLDIIGRRLQLLGSQCGMVVMLFLMGGLIKSKPASSSTDRSIADLSCRVWRKRENVSHLRHHRGNLPFPSLLRLFDHPDDKLIPNGDMPVQAPSYWYYAIPVL